VDAGLAGVWVMNGERLKRAFTALGVRAGVRGAVPEACTSTLYPMLTPVPSGTRGGVVRRKSVRPPASGCVMGSDMDLPCKVGRRLSVARSVSVSRGLCFSFTYDSLDRALRASSQKRSPAIIAPRNIPVINPIAKEEPENLECDPEPTPAASPAASVVVGELPLLADVVGGTLAPGEVDEATELAGVPTIAAAGTGADAAAHCPSWQE